MCTGHSPFRASGTHAVLKRVIDASPRPIREINDEIPAWLCDVIAKLHAKKSDERFQTAKEVADLLGQYLAHLQRPHFAPRPSHGALVAAPMSPQPAWGQRVGAGMLLVLGFSLILAGLWLLGRPVPISFSPREYHLEAWMVLVGGLVSL